MRVFLTGGTGLIGSHVAERLRGRGDEVVALVRETSDTAHLDTLGCELVVGDVLDPPDAQARRMRGADAVVHAAARVFRSGSRATFLRENVEGTERVLSAAGLVAPRVVHVSSVAVYAGLSMEEPLTEERWTGADPDRQSPYAASKHLSERAAWRLHEQGAIRLTTVRPCVVYGERDRAATPIMVRYASLPLVPLLAGGRRRLPLVYAGNVAVGIVSALDRPAAAGRAYNLAFDQAVTARELVAWIGEELGRRPRTVSIPAFIPRAVAGLLRALGPLLPSGKAGMRRAIHSLLADDPYDSSRARLDLGWSGHVPHREAVRRTIRWWEGRDLRPRSGRP